MWSLKPQKGSLSQRKCPSMALRFSCLAPFSMPLILALSPTLCPVLSGREEPHLLPYFRPFSNYTLTLVIYIMSLIPKR